MLEGRTRSIESRSRLSFSAEVVEKRTRLFTDGEGRDGTVVEECDAKSREGREVELEGEDHGGGRKRRRLTGEGERKVSELLGGEKKAKNKLTGADVDQAIVYALDDDSGLRDGGDRGSKVRAR